MSGVEESKQEASEVKLEEIRFSEFAVAQLAALDLGSSNFIADFKKQFGQLLQDTPAIKLELDKVLSKVLELNIPDAFTDTNYESEIKPFLQKIDASLNLLVQFMRFILE